MSCVHNYRRQILLTIGAFVVATASARHVTAADNKVPRTKLAIDVQDRWTLGFRAKLVHDLPDVTVARTRITQPHGYVHTFQTPVTTRDDHAVWNLMFPLSDETSYRPKDRRADWHKREYSVHVDLMAGDDVISQADEGINQLNFMPREFRGVLPLIGLYDKHLLQCSPDRPVYVDHNTVSFQYRSIPDRLDRCTATADVVKPGSNELLAGPWQLELTGQLERHTFSSADWPRGEYWIRIRPHRDGQPVGAYMVRAFWKEILPPEKLFPVHSITAYQNVAGTGGFRQTSNVRFDSDPMTPRPDGWVVSKDKPWETEFCSVSGLVKYDEQTRQYQIEYQTVNVREDPDFKSTVCRLVSEDGVNWQRPVLGKVNYGGSTGNNILCFSGRDESGKPMWPVAPHHRQRVQTEPDLLPDLEKVRIRFYDAERDGPINPKNCFLKNIKWDLLAMIKDEHIDPAVRARYSNNIRSPEHNLFLVFAAERRGDDLLILSPDPVLRGGSGMDLYHSSESYRYMVEDRSTGTYYFYFRPGAPSYPPHYAVLDNIHELRRTLAVMWTHDFVNWERRFVLSPDEDDLPGTQFYHIYIHHELSEAAKSSPGAVLAGMPAVDGGRVYLASVSNYDAITSQIWPELMWTSDFIHFHRFQPRKRMVANSGPGQYSFGAVRHNGVFTEIGDTWWLVALGYRQPYKYPSTFGYRSIEELSRKRMQFKYARHFENWEQFYRYCDQQYGINPMLAVAPAGRLAHAQPDDVSQVAMLVTGPVLLNGNSLVINGKANDGGSIKVELLSKDGRPLPGYDLKSCDPLTSDQLRHEVLWKGKGVTPTVNAPVQIRFVLDRANLYGFTAR